MNQGALVSEAFTELAPEYEATMDRELRMFWALGYREFVDRLLASAAVDAGERVLDIATGTAVLPASLAKAGAAGRVVGLDITPAMLEQGRRRLEADDLSASVDLVCASAMALPFIPGAFDVVICGLGTHHMDVPRMLSEARRVLRKGGRLIIADVGASAFWRSFWGRLLLHLLLLRYRLAGDGVRARAEAEAFPNVRTAAEWQLLLAGPGFVGIEITESPARYPWYPSALNIIAEAP